MLTQKKNLLPGLLTLNKIIYLLLATEEITLSSGLLGKYMFNSLEKRSCVFIVDFKLLLPNCAFCIHIYLLFFRVVRWAGVYGNVSVDVKVGNNTKKIFPLQQRITFKEGEKYQTFEIHIVDDDVPELNQKISLELSDILGTDSNILFVIFFARLKLIVKK